MSFYETLLLSDTAQETDNEDSQEINKVPGLIELTLQQRPFATLPPLKTRSKKQMVKCFKQSHEQ